MRILLLFISLISLITETFGKTTHILTITPTFEGIILEESEWNFCKLTLFNESRTDSLILPRYSNCTQLRAKLPQYTGKFMLYDKLMNYTQVRLEHPEFLTSFHSLDVESVDQDSVDQFNKRHHILIHHNAIDLERECPEKKPFDFKFWNDHGPLGGYHNPNHIAVLFKDTLDSTQTANFLNTFKLDSIRTENNGKLWLLKLKKGKLKPGNNKVLKSIISDTLMVKDAGIVLDTNNLTFLSSFVKINSLSLDDIEKHELSPISGLTSYFTELAYIKTHDLRMGCGLYRFQNGEGVDVFNWQFKTNQKEIDKKCKQQELCLKLDLDYLKLQTKTYSSSGGKDTGKKAINNTEKMTQLFEEEKVAKIEYAAKTGRVELIVIKAEEIWPEREQIK